MPRSAKRDNTETAARNFDDERSFVSLEGHEYLYGKDWKQRKKKMFARDEKRCQWITHENEYVKYRCMRPAEHIHHIKPKGKGGSDDLYNLMAICREHHKLCHPEKELRWSKRANRNI